MSKGMIIIAMCKSFLLKIGSLQASSPAPYLMRPKYLITISLFPFPIRQRIPKTTAVAGKMCLTVNNFMFVMQKNGFIMKTEIRNKICFEYVWFSSQFIFV